MPAPRDPAGLTAAAVDTERHVARMGWDQPPRLFALVRSRELARREPALRSRLTGGPAEGEQKGDEPAEDGYTAVEQDGLPPSSDLASMLGRIAWPSEVDGVALAVERMVVPPDAERDLPWDAPDAADRLAAHPGRRDVRVLVAVLRSGAAVCLLRQRRYDADDAVAMGPDIAPGLVHALRATLEPDRP